MCCPICLCLEESVCASLALCYTLFDQSSKKIAMYSHEKSVGGNDRHCPRETSFHCTCVCVCECECMYVRGKTVR